MIRQILPCGCVNECDSKNHDTADLVSYKQSPKPDRFWSKVNYRIRGCWNWTGNMGSGGYGRIRMGNGYGRAHRISWERINGPIPAGMLVLHKCDNRACVNPSHLFLGTHLDNTRDMDSKGRRRTVAPKGERHVRAKLTEKEAEDILFLRGILSQSKIAIKFGITKSIVSHIHQRITWRHLDESKEAA